MANYSKLDGYVFDKQSNVGWGLTLKMSGKSPAVAKRIFDTYEHALAYANDVKDSAIEGLVLSVVADGDKNGVYFVQSIKTEGSTNAAVLVKLGSEAGASGNLSAAIKALNVTDTAVAGEFVSEVSQTDGKISVKRASLADAKVDEDKEGHAISLTDKLTALNQSVVDEKTARENAFNTLKGTLGEGDATTLGAINYELDAIDAKIGTVTTGKTVVGMIEAAEAAAKAAATKMKLADNEELLTLSHTTDKAGAITYALGTNNVASDAELQAEKERALAAEGKLQSQIGTVTTGKTVVQMIADVKDAYEAAIEAMDVTKTGEGNFVDVTVKQANGVITEVTVAESDIASKKALDDEVTRAKAAEKTNADAITTLNGDATKAGSVAKAVKDAKDALLGDAAEEYNTLGKLEDKIIKVSGDAKTYSISQVVGDELTSLGANVKEAYKLVENGNTGNTTAGEYIKVYKDSALQSVALVGQELQFTYILANGQTSTVSVDVSNFLAESEFANGLQVVNHVVSVKRDSTSEGFLTVSADGIKLSGVQTAIDAAKKVATDRLDVIESKDQTVVGSISKALKDAKDYTDTQISDLDATVGSQTVASGKHVAVEVVEENGKLKTLTVNESDIASATGLTSEINRAKAAEEANAALIATLNGNTGTTGSVAKAVADAKTELLGVATTDYNTLGKLENKVKAVDAAAKAAATKISAKTTGHVTVSSSKDKTTSALTYTISENDIASANALTAETKAREDADNALDVRLDVLEGVTVKGKDAIVVSASGATESKVVSLKLGAQPGEGVAGVVLSQNADGLVAKLQWGTF